ncbi:universal stress protein [Pseudomaricurvus alkylphenolicus]|uniref:universal stress protein n=1 Tax=Pseudomaricurvus alkylphenolicus TaxID=1306991 RepID=UPI0014224DDA|nr:universal stress protein [Pseudomaricurvus alkylphenolicus]NIB41441.1 universal stress protein [Pseudomaricurvus alkylphenolicus]
MVKSILVISDIRETDHCSLRKAHDIAIPLGDKIDVVRFIKAGGTSDSEDINLNQQSEILRTSLDEIFADYENKDRISSQVVATDDIAQWVTNYCKDKDFDFIVKAGHRSESLFHTPCDWELIRSLQTPVLIASQQHWHSKHTVLAALNPTAKDEVHCELNNDILKWAKKWTQTFDCELHIVYNLPVSNVLKELDIIDIKEHARSHRAEGEEQVSVLLKEHDLSKAKVHIVAGAPEQTIPQCANKLKAELVIMGSMGRRGLKRVLKSNTAEKVMHNLRTDSLIIESKK